MLARLAALLGGSQEFARRALPLLVGANAAAAPARVRGTAAYALACVTGVCARGGCQRVARHILSTLEMQCYK